MGRGNVSAGLAAGGPEMGNAHATIVLDTSGLVASANRAKQIGPQIERALDGIGESAKRTEAFMDSLSRATHLGRLRSEAIRAAEALEAARTNASLAAGAMSSAGGAAQQAAGGLTAAVTAGQQAQGALQGVGTAAQQAQVNLAATSAAAQQAQAALQTVGAAAQQAQANLAATSNAAQQTQNSLGLIGQSARAAGGLIASYLTVQTAQAGLELARTAARADQMGQRFAFLANIAGQSADEMMVAMRRASRAHISDVDLMFAANRSMLFGVADTIEEMEALMRIAGARAGAMGISFNDAFEAIIMGIGRLEPRWLQQIGLTINAQQAFATYAEQLGKSAGDLTEAERRIAIYNTTIDESRSLVEQHTSAGVSASGRFQQLSAAVSNAQVRLGNVFMPEAVSGAEALTIAVNGLAQAFDWLAQKQEETRKHNEGALALWTLTGRMIANQLGISLPEPSTQVAAPSGPLPSTAPGHRIGAPRFSDEIQTAQRDYYLAIKDIERNANTARLESTRQYERQRSQTIAAYGLSMAREEEDFQRGRARRLSQHEEAIERIRNDAADREAQWATDLAERIGGIQEQDARRHADAVQDFEERRAQQQAELEERRGQQEETYNERVTKLREDGLKSIAKAEMDAIRQRERAERQHRDTLLNAAANLDARAVAQEMRRWQTAQADHERTLTERIAQEQTSLQERLEQERENYEKQLRENQAAHDKRLAQDQTEFDKRREREQRDLQLRIAQEQTAHAKRIADARAADEQRIADQQAAFVAQLAQEDVERQIRLNRQAADHRAQLEEMARAQGDRMTQMNNQERDRLNALKDAFGDQLHELGLHNDAYLVRQRATLTASMTMWNKYFSDWITEQERALNTLPRPRPEFPSLLDPWTMPGQGGMIGPAPGPSSYNTRNITIAPGAVVVHALPGMNEEMLGDIVERRLVRVLEGVVD